jgi:hypothetical protein
MIVKAGEVICIALGIFENYDRAGPFVATQDFDLDSFIHSRGNEAAHREMGSAELVWGYSQGAFSKTGSSPSFLVAKFT